MADGSRPITDLDQASRIAEQLRADGDSRAAARPVRPRSKDELVAELKRLQDEVRIWTEMLRGASQATAYLPTGFAARNELAEAKKLFAGEMAALYIKIALVLKAIKDLMKKD